MYSLPGREVNSPLAKVGHLSVLTWRFKKSAISALLNLTQLNRLRRILEMRNLKLMSSSTFSHTHVNTQRHTFRLAFRHTVSQGLSHTLNHTFSLTVSHPSSLRTYAWLRLTQ